MAGAIRCRRVSLADIGRSMRTDALCKHRIKRVWRFLRNRRVDVVEGMRSLVGVAAKASGGRLIVAVDWVDVRQYKVLRAAVPLRGRSVPVLFASYEKWNIFKSQNRFEEGFFHLLKALVPARCEVVIVADAGFARAELARTLQGLGLHYVIRTGGKVWFSCAGHTGNLSALPLRRGSRKDLGFGEYRKHRPVRRRVVAYWASKNKEPWLLATDLEWGWKRIVAAYSRRMMIEELFRDEKNIRYGWGLRQSRVSSSDRLNRLLLVLAFAYLWLLMLGIVCREEMSAAHWASGTSTRRRQTSAFVVGRIMLDEVRFPLRLLLRRLANLLSQLAEENWG